MHEINHGQKQLMDTAQKSDISSRDELQMCNTE